MSLGNEIKKLSDAVRNHPNPDKKMLEAWNKQIKKISGEVDELDSTTRQRFNMITDKVESLCRAGEVELNHFLKATEHMSGVNSDDVNQLLKETELEIKSSHLVSKTSVSQSVSYPMDENDEVAEIVREAMDKARLDKKYEALLREFEEEKTEETIDENMSGVFTDEVQAVLEHTEEHIQELEQELKLSSTKSVQVYPNSLEEVALRIDNQKARLEAIRDTAISHQKNPEAIRRASPEEKQEIVLQRQIYKKASLLSKVIEWVATPFKAFCNLLIAKNSIPQITYTNPQKNSEESHTKLAKSQKALGLKIKNDKNQMLDIDKKIKSHKNPQQKRNLLQLRKILQKSIKKNTFLYKNIDKIAKAQNKLASVIKNS